MNESDCVDGLIEDARAALGRARAAVPPDFAAVIARAAALAGQDSAPIVLTTEDDEDEGVVVDIRTRPRVPTADGLDGLVADARAAVERMVEGTGMRAIPPMPRVRPRRRLAAVVGAFGLCAAAAAVAFAVLQWPEPARLAEDATPLDQSMRVDATSEVPGTAVEQAVPRRAPAAEATPELILEVPVTSPEIATPVPETGRPTVRRVDAEALRALSDEARALWRSGDRSGAEAKFLEVTRIGGRTPLAELAWGDLFALARQMGDDGRLAKRWKGYVARFPRGRYADDARAGLCRTSAKAGPCWAGYLRDFPRGSYRAEASLAVPEGG